MKRRRQSSVAKCAAQLVEGTAGRTYSPKRIAPSTGLSSCNRAVQGHAEHVTDGDVAPFVRSLYALVDDGDTANIISWTGASETTFTVWDNGAMERTIIPRYFRHRNFTSFLRQLNQYGFRKVSTDAVFYHPNFCQEKPELLKFIRRKQRPKRATQEPPSQQSQDNAVMQAQNALLTRELREMRIYEKSLAPALVPLRQMVAAEALRRHETETTIMSLIEVLPAGWPLYNKHAPYLPSNRHAPAIAIAPAPSATYMDGFNAGQAAAAGHRAAAATIIPLPLRVERPPTQVLPPPPRPRLVETAVARRMPPGVPSVPGGVGSQGSHLQTLQDACMLMRLGMEADGGLGRLGGMRMPSPADVLI